MSRFSDLFYETWLVNQNGCFNGNLHQYQWQFCANLSKALATKSSGRHILLKLDRGVSVLFTADQK